MKSFSSATNGWSIIPPGGGTTISFKGSLYEVPAAYIRQRIEIRHPVDDPQELSLYDNGLRIGKIRLLDKQENARTFRPQKASTRLSFHKGEVRP